VAKGMYTCVWCINSKNLFPTSTSKTPVKKRDIITSFTFTFTSLDVFVRLHCLPNYWTSTSTGTPRLQSFWPDCKHRSSQRANRYWHHSLLEGIHYFSEGSICHFLCSSISFWWLSWRFEVSECDYNDDSVQ
jgi:hypothetical protein